MLLQKSPGFARRGSFVATRPRPSLRAKRGNPE